LCPLLGLAVEFDFFSKIRVDENPIPHLRRLACLQTILALAALSRPGSSS
jgi:hypothetical protein